MCLLYYIYVSGQGLFIDTCLNLVGWFNNKVRHPLLVLSFVNTNWLQWLRWLDWIFLGGYLPSLSINYVTMSKDMEKRFPQLYYIKMKNYDDLSFIAIGVAMAT